jgi:transcription initiation factor TFIID subunit TAF12
MRLAYIWMSAASIKEPVSSIHAGKDVVVPACSESQQQQQQQQQHQQQQRRPYAG